MTTIATWITAAMLAVAAASANAQTSSAEARAAAAEARAAAAAARAQVAAERAARQGITVRSHVVPESETRYYAPPPSIGEAPPHITYMSPRCSALHDALRTAAARGLNHDTVAKMRRDYPGECSENESEAQRQLAAERRDKSLEKRQAQTSEIQQRDRSALRQEQCGESKRILVTKRARTDLTEGEKAELQRFETNYRTRCG